MQFDEREGEKDISGIGLRLKNRKIGKDANMMSSANDFTSVHTSNLSDKPKSTEPARTIHLPTENEKDVDDQFILPLDVDQVKGKAVNKKKHEEAPEFGLIRDEQSMRT